MKQFVYLCLFLSVIVFVSGCGETIRGMGRDLTRVGRGIKTVFVSDYN